MRVFPYIDFEDIDNTSCFFTRERMDCFVVDIGEG